MNQTKKYQLNLWDKTDRIQMEDFNADNAKIEAALSSVAEQAALISKRGNCALHYGSYVGTGSGSTVLTFEKTPLFLTIMGTNMWLVAVKGAPYTIAKTAGNGTDKCNAVWSGTSVSITSEDSDSRYQCNNVGETYYVVALMDTAS